MKTLLNQESLLYGPILIIIVIVGFSLNLFSLRVLKYGERLYQTREAIPAFCSAGLKNNILIGYDQAEKKFWRCRTKRLQRRITTYLLWIIYCDLFLLICSLLTFISPLLIHFPNMVMQSTYIHLVPLWYVFCNMAFMISYWIMFTLMADRYVHICTPFSNNFFKRLLSTKKIPRLLLFECFLAFLISFPRFYEVYIHYNHTESSYFISDSLIANKNLYILLYRLIFGVILSSVLPYIITIIMCYKVLKVLRTADSDRFLITASYTHTTESNLIFAAFIGKFIISHLMPISLDFVEFLLGAEVFNASYFCMHLVQLSNTIVSIVSSFNFIMLFLSSSVFRKNSVHLLRYKKK